MNLFLVVILAVFAISMVIGFNRGLVGGLVGTAATIVAIILTGILTPFFNDAIVKYTDIDEIVEQKVYTAIENEVKKQTEKKLEEKGLSIEQINVTTEQVQSIMSENLSKANQVGFIKELAVPEFVKTGLLDNNNGDIYEMLGVTSVYKYVSTYISRVVVNALASLSTFLIVKLILTLVTLTLTTIVKELPILKSIDRAGGTALGAVVALLISWIIIMVMPLCGEAYTEMIDSSVILSFLSNHNVLANIVGNIFI